ncbi:MAG: DNA polymerase III subunit delta' C-terminal domain-containing protein [Christensenellales bacterium]
MESEIKYFLKSKKLMEFAKSLVQKGLKQAYLFTSQDKTKNYAFCKILSLFALCRNKSACLCCDACKKVLDENCLDFFVYPKDKSIVVDDIKEIIESCYVLPLENECKIYVLNRFDEANVSVQNKFLKTLEEPPQNVIFLLNATKSDMVLETIKSRCEKIVIPSFDELELKTLLEENNIEVNQTILENCELEFGNYVNMQSCDFEKDFEFCLSVLTNMKSSSDILKFSSQILKMKNLENFFKAMLSIFRDILVFKTQESKINNKSHSEAIETLSQDFSQKAVCEIINNLIASNKELSFNGAVNLIIDCILIDILEEKHKWN